MRLCVARTGLPSAHLVALWPPETFYCPPAASIIEEHGRSSHGHFNVIHRDSAMRADRYLAGADALTAWALPLRVARILPRHAPLPTRQEARGRGAALAVPRFA